MFIVQVKWLNNVNSDGDDYLPILQIRKSSTNIILYELILSVSQVNADSADTFATAPSLEAFNDDFYEVPDNDNEFPLPVSPGEGCTVLYDYVGKYSSCLTW